MNGKGTVFVGLSGGVDSSVAALRLQKQGYQVVGVFIKVWHPDFLECNWEDERLDAMRVAAHLNIPFLTCDAEEVYKRDVGEYFVREYTEGRTPNPDVMCNQHVKFGAFLEFARLHKADYIATGHYVQKTKVDDTYQLKRGVDVNKDQSYFLWTLQQKQLAHILFPIGDTTKDSIRAEAEEAGLPTFSKKDSQGICFLGHVDIPEFISHFTELSPGSVLDAKGNKIGMHQGAIVYTLGQRHGFTLTTNSTQKEPHYVIAKDVESNTITTDVRPPQLTASNRVVLSETNIIEQPTVATRIEVQFRYRQAPIGARLHIEADKYIVELLEDTEKAAVGQSCVLYQGDVCLGGGIIAAYANHKS